MKNNKHKKSTQNYGSAGKPTSTVLKLTREDLFESGIVKCMPPCTYYTGIFPDLPHLLQVCISRGEPEADGSRSFLLCGINLQKGIVEVAMIEFALERYLFDGMLKEFSLKPYEDKMALERLIYDAYARHKAIDCKFPEEFLAGMHIMHFSKNEVKKAALIAAFQHRSLSASIESGSAAKDFLEG
ncbi:hypothetical protein FSB73_00140 [Arachidicoccus ginsenosidivorans]|uniref:Uncharacterized protein n=1 Tax=Arachidicoccus ginsenosidivorans TaxID=496057 RepID=A0A5B8VFH9_9BACT|nr:hypothetical protein [Arachidicoccus ginsenosidivorans]QEC70357.1 hypothetical protein FSB73_00140 [Arachidicoccus ginsenosidivorans]